MRGRHMINSLRNAQGQEPTHNADLGVERQGQNSQEISVFLQLLQTGIIGSDKPNV